MSSCFAFSLTETFHLKKPAQPLVKSKIGNDVNVVEFTGKWQGRCDGSDEDQVLKIESTPTSITIDDKTFEIDSAVNVESMNTAEYINTNSFSFHWNSTGSALKLTELNSMLTLYDAPVTATFIKAIFKRHANQMIIYYQSKMILDGEPVEEMKLQCIYNKID